LLERNRTHRNFDSQEEVKTYVKDELRGLSKDDLFYQLEKWECDLHSIIDAQGDYL